MSMSSLVACQLILGVEDRSEPAAKNGGNQDDAAAPSSASSVTDAMTPVDATSGGVDAGVVACPDGQQFCNRVA